MEKVVYLILSREKDTFNILYVSDCEKTDNRGFFTQNSRFKCWVDKSGSEKFLHLAIFPMFDSSPDQRKQVISKIIARYQPICNTQDIPKEKSDYVIRPKNESRSELDKTTSEKIICPCCGAEMKTEKALEKSSIIKCTECGLSDTKLNS
jgi:hypothetical protein